MSDYISKDETISTIWNVFNSYGNSAMHFEVEETKAIRKFCSRLQREIELLPTVDEKEIIRKPMERIKERIDEKMESIDYWTKPFDKYEYYDNGFWEGMNEVATIVEEEGGTSEM